MSGSAASRSRPAVTSPRRQILSMSGRTVFVASGSSGNSASRRRSSGTRNTPASQGGRRVRWPVWLAAQAHGAGCRPDDAGDDLEQRRAAGTDDPGDPVDLAPTDVERHVAESTIELDPVDGQEGRAIGPPTTGVLGGEVGGQLLTGHQRHQAVLVEGLDRFVGDDVSITHDDDAFADGEDLLEAVGDVDDGGPVVAEAPDQLEESLRLGRAQGRGGLVEEQVLRTRADGARDLDELSVGRRQRLDERVGAERGAHAVEPLLGHRLRPTLRVDTALRRLHAQQQVLGHAERRHEDRLLADGVDPSVTGTVWVEVVNRHAGDREGARVRVIAHR